MMLSSAYAIFAASAALIVGYQGLVRAIPVNPAGQVRPSSLANGPASPASYNPANFNPAILHIRYTQAPGKTADPAKDAFIDLTLIGPDASPGGRRVEVNSVIFRSLLQDLYRRISRQDPMAVTSPGSSSRKLYDVLLAPVGGLLKEQSISTLLIAVDRGLQAVPFAALTDGAQYFGEAYAFSLTPSLTLTDLDSVSTRSDDRLLALGSSRFQSLSPLPIVPEELAQISPGDHKDVRLNEDFTPEVFLSQSADPRYSRVHVATHAEFVPGGPSKSSIYSGTGPIALDQLAKLRKKRKGVPLDLIVFSACRTALGDPESELGFAGLALQAGSKSAIGTLWYVDDVVTSAYFVQMYRYLDSGVPKAEALQLTRYALIKGLIRVQGNEVIGVDGSALLTGLTPSQVQRMKQNTAHPFYWAGIQLLGTPW